MCVTLIRPKPFISAYKNRDLRPEVNELPPPKPKKRKRRRAFSDDEEEEKEQEDPADKFNHGYNEFQFGTKAQAEEPEDAGNTAWNQKPFQFEEETQKQPSQPKVVEVKEEIDLLGGISGAKKPQEQPQEEIGDLLDMGSLAPAPQQVVAQQPGMNVLGGMTPQQLAIEQQLAQTQKAQQMLLARQQQAQ